MKQSEHMREDILISVIVPVYNAKAYLMECLSSIQEQTFHDWECICVDDGSSDESPAMVEEFTAKDSRFRLIRQTNAGPGIARNTGLESAKGEYFAFVDSDDLVHPEMLENLWSMAKAYDADLVVCRFAKFTKDCEFFRSAQGPIFLADKTEVYQAPFLHEIVNWEKFRVHPFGKLYRHALHGSLRFPCLWSAEDTYASFDVWANSNRTAFSNASLYGYRIREGSLTRSVSKYRNYIVGSAAVGIHCEDVTRKHGLKSNLRANLVAFYGVKPILFHLYEMSCDTRLSTQEKRDLIVLAGKALRNIKRGVAGNYRIIPVVHFVGYCAVYLRALWLLKLWQWIRMHTVAGG